MNELVLAISGQRVWRTSSTRPHPSESMAQLVDSIVGQALGLRRPLRPPCTRFLAPERFRKGPPLLLPTCAARDPWVARSGDKARKRARAAIKGSLHPTYASSNSTPARFHRGAPVIRALPSAIHPLPGGRCSAFHGQFDGGSPGRVGTRADVQRRLRPPSLTSSQAGGCRGPASCWQ